MKTYFNSEAYPNPEGRKMYPSSSEIVQPDWLLYMSPAGVENLRDACIKESIEKKLNALKELHEKSGIVMSVKLLVEQVKHHHLVQEKCRDEFKYGKDEEEGKFYFKKYIDRDVDRALDDALESHLDSRE